MKRPAQKVFVLAIGVIMLIAGCEEQNVSSTKKGRLIANENRQLKKELEQRDNEIEKQEKLLEKYLQENKDLQEQSQKNVEVLMNEIFETVAEENTKLREEIKSLKAKIEELKKPSGSER